MAKVTISRIFEISKYLATKSGKELEDPLRYLSDFSELTLRALRNQLTFGENLDCEIKMVKLRTSIPTVISPATRRRVVRLTIDQVVDNVYYVVSKFGWKYNANGDLIVFAAFTNEAGGSPASTTNINTSLVIHFG